MVRETRTLKGLFADPQPPRRKNFIKENVKSVRQMDKLFHANDNNLKNFKLQVQNPRTVKITRSKDIDKSYAANRNGLLESRPDGDGGELAKLLSNKLYLENSVGRKKSAPPLSSKKVAVKKLRRPSIHGNVLKKNQRSCHKDQADQKDENKQKLKSHSIGDIGSQALNEEISNSASIKCKSQGVQTLDGKDIESIYSEGIIRYPSGKSKEVKSPARGDLDSSEQLVQESTRTNKESMSVASKLASQLTNGAPPSSYRVGVVPKYLKERKEALHKEQLAKIASKQSSDCPKGHVPLPDCERRETLGIFKKNYQEYVRELNSLPIRTDTLRSQRRKMEIEKQLAKLEEAIKVFSRPKVFVKVDS